MSWPLGVATQFTSSRSGAGAALIVAAEEMAAAAIAIHWSISVPNALVTEALKQVRRQRPSSRSPRSLRLHFHQHHQARARLGGGRRLGPLDRLAGDGQ